MNTSQTQNQIVFIDSAVADPATLMAGLAPGTEVVMLQPGRDGLSQIAAALAGRSNLQSIHLISHGSSGQILLGSTSLSSANLAQYQSSLQDIGSHLSASGDILIYGCDVAAGAQGQNLVQQIAHITQADVAASTTLTGAAALGGDWVLEYQAGHVDSTLPMAVQALADYGHILTANAAPVMTLPSSLSFAAKVDYATGAYAGSVTSADVNGDLKADLIVANSNSGTVSVLKNNGNGTFAAKVDYVISGPYSVTSADVNGDSKADLIVGTYSSGVSVLLNKNDGTGSFAAKVDYPTGGIRGWSVTSADVDGINGADLIVANYGGNNVSVLKNNGNGTFAARVDYATGIAPMSVTSADVNGDGKVDLIVANSTDNTVSVLLGTGTGTFAAKVDYVTGSAPNSVTSADVNGDGKADLIVANKSSSTVSVLLGTGTGTGTFAAKVDYATGSGTRSVASADVDGDGKVDLIVTNGSDKVSVLKNNGDGTFAAKLDYTAGSAPNSVTSADVNGDGKADLIAANINDGTVSVLLNTSGPLATAFTEQTSVAASSAITISDADGNGDWNGGSLKVQITAANEAADSLRLATSNPGSSGIWLDGTMLMAGSIQIGSADAAAVDNGAAWTFSFTASATNALVQATAQAVQFNNTSDTPGTASRSVTFTATDKNAAAVSAAQTITVTAVNDAPTISAIPGTAQAVTAGTAAALADFTVADVDSNSLSVTLTANNGVIGGLTDADSNTAGIQLTGTAAAINTAIAAATFTATAAGSASIGISVSDGVVATPVTATYSLSAAAANVAPTITLPTSLSFAAKVDYATGNNADSNPYSVTSADVNGDGKADLIVANSSSSTVSVLLNKNDGSGSFAAKLDYATGSTPRQVTSADVDGDGKADLIVANYSSTVSVLLNTSVVNGPVTFASKVDYLTASGPYSVTSADVDGDGKADLIVANSGSANVSVLLNKNDGTGTFLPKADYATGSGPFSVTSADVNGDLKADLIVVNISSSKVSVLLNTGVVNGSVTFASKVDYDTGGYSYSVTSADVNGDLKADLIVASTGSKKVSVLLGTGTGTFASKVDYATGGYSYSVTSADVDGDGKADLIATNDNGTVSVLLNKNDGTGTFLPKDDYATGGGARSVTSADVNADGKADLIVANQYDGTVSVLKNSTGLVSFTEQTAVAASSAITISDADGNADWNGGSLKVQITAANEAADSLRLATSNPGGSSGIWLDGTMLMAGATQIGSADAASVANGDAWTFSFTTNATNALVQATAQAVQFNNSSDTPGTASRSVTFTATDKNAAAVSVAQTITVTAVNDAPTISAVPGTAQAATAGTAAALADFTVADVDSNSLSVTLTANNGVIGGLTDADSITAGIQLTGTAAAINTAIAAATFTATAAGAASIGISVRDGVVITPTSASYNLTATAAPTPAPDPTPTPTPDPTPAPTPTPTPILDNDGVPDAQESAAPGLTPAGGGAAVAGDGNGDGVADSQQSTVTSVAFLNTPTSQSNPASAPPVYVTLVAGSLDGKIDTGAASSATLNNVRQLDAPANRPAEIKMPLGLIAFTAAVQTAGIAETFSLYVAPTLGVNGYWKTNAAGTWVNLGSAAYGGKIVTEGGKIRMDFKITDGSEFDGDGKADGVITDPGAAGFMPLSIVGYAPELAAGTHFWF